MAFEEKERDWNAIETKCIGLGDPYCEFKLVPEEIDELQESLKKDSSVIERINRKLMESLLKYILEGKPLVERPKLGSDIHIEMALAARILPIALGSRYQMAVRMGGVKIGKELGERLINSGLKEGEAIKGVMKFMDYCKVGKINIKDTIKIKENCESLWVKVYTEKLEEPSCFFTTGFLNGFFSAVKNKNVREVKCIAVGDPYCEWEIG